MILTDLISVARYRVDDLVAPYLWSDTEWTEYLNDAQNEACRRARLIVDSTTASICSISLTNLGVTYPLDDRILFIKRVKLSGRVTPLLPASFKDLDRVVPGWEDETGEPTSYVKDMDDNLFRPYPTPAAAYTVNLTVIRLPLIVMDDSDQSPEIKPRWHLSLVHWMLYRAYSKQDSETRDAKKAAENLAMFENEFGKKSTAQDETWINREHGYTEEEGVYQ